MESIRQRVRERLSSCSGQDENIYELFGKHSIHFTPIIRSYMHHWNGIQHHSDMTEKERQHAHTHNYHHHLHSLAHHLMKKSKYHSNDPHWAYDNARKTLHALHGPEHPHTSPMMHLGHKP